MKVKKRVIILAILLGLITMVLLYNYIESMNEVEAIPVDLTNVVVAVSSIPAHVNITSDMVTIKTIPSEAVHPDAVLKIDDIVGFTTNMNIFNDEQILMTKVVTETQTASLSYRIPENMRAIAIPMTELTGVGGYLIKGDRIDILVSYEEIEVNSEEQEEITNLVTYTQFQNIEILEKGPNIAAVEGATADAGVTSSLTILVTPEQAEVITYALNSGAINMTLRNPVDDTVNEMTRFGDAEFTSWKGR